jgi:predicted Fe-Mo cluster-binding NifX family protein
MRIAVATNNGGLEDVVSSVFARAPTFTIVDIDNGEIKDVRVMQNPAAMAGGGAGIQASQVLVNEGVQAVIAGNFGPNASGVLAQAGVAMISMPGARVEDAVKSAEKNPQSASIPQAPQAPVPPAPPVAPYGYGYGPGMGFGRGRGMGYGRGRGWWAYGSGWDPYAPPAPPAPAPMSKDDEIRYLEDQKKAIERRLKELKGEE